MPKQAIRTALSALQAVPVSISSWTDEPWLMPDDARTWRSFSPTQPDAERVILLPYRDPFVHARRPVALLTGSGSVPVLDADLTRVAIRRVSSLRHHAVVRGGELVNGERRTFALLRPIADVTTQDRIRDLVLEAFADSEAAAAAHS